LNTKPRDSQQDINPLRQHQYELQSRSQSHIWADWHGAVGLGAVANFMNQKLFHVTNPTLAAAE
jgi:hypothetical protein